MAQLLSGQRHSVDLGASNKFSEIRMGRYRHSVEIFFRSHGTKHEIDQFTKHVAKSGGFHISVCDSRITLMRQNASALSTTPEEFNSFVTLVRAIVRVPQELWGSDEYVAHVSAMAANTPILNKAQLFAKEAWQKIARIEKNNHFVFSRSIDFEEVSTWNVAATPVPIILMALRMQATFYRANRLVGITPNDDVSMVVIRESDIALAAKAVAELGGKY